MGDNRTSTIEQRTPLYAGGLTIGNNTMKLYRKSGEDDWCGPFALSVITGKPADDFTQYRDKKGGMYCHQAMQALRTLGYRCKLKIGNPYPIHWQRLGLDGYTLTQKQFTLKLAKLYFGLKYYRKPCLLLLTINRHFVVYDPRTQELVDNGYMVGKEPIHIDDFNQRYTVDGFITVKPERKSKSAIPALTLKP